MYEAAEYARQGNVDYFRSMPDLELQALTVGRDEDGRTLLHTAAANGYLSLVQLLAAHGAARVVSKQDDEVSKD
jgi:ankyrin repeat protein